ncbi:MAG: zinc-dependent alcohol dehydrogenase family protein [Thermoanaerobaculia bacterium]|nr:zinc-dependent alcohol dehydrogenase family protein [Thermoanaerobaculia bacterium]
MRAIVLQSIGGPLVLEERAVAEPGPGQLLLRVRACAVCRTDLHLVDGELRDPRLPIVPGHQIVGIVERAGRGAGGHRTGDRVGVPWLGWTCGACPQCIAGRENLCPDARFTGCQIDGGFADYAVADARYCFPIPERFGDAEAAPLLCGGLIGYRALRMAGDATRLGLYGFGSAAHVIAQVARAEGRQVFAFTRTGDVEGQRFARSLGAVWAGGSGEAPPVALDAAIIFAPVGALVPAALQAVRPGGTVVCAGIHMSDIPSFPYALLWEERSVRSVANLTRQDGEEFFATLSSVELATTISEYSLERAGDALDDLRHGRFDGSAVLRVSV